MKCLRESYLGKVKVIYIDPPYNTGTDFIYKDSFSESKEGYISRSGQIDKQGNILVSNLETNGRFHTDWLNMIYPRLKVARDFLSDDGVIFISIDDNELYSTKLICDELFGSSNFLGNLVIQTATDNNPTQVKVEHEYIICYAKNKVVQQPWSARSEKIEIIKGTAINLSLRFDCKFCPL
ncbi:site-specific DNA-methyltransferase [uncultured Sutterella sp.]|uniref:site-specific DNA-methyltransferase n=1 Tax=uncultured Sutterella sp. TaxID=286133 RepID=UPI003439AAA0